MKRVHIRLLLAFSVLCAFIAHAAPPSTFEKAKEVAREHVYYDQHVGGATGTLYCGCDWQWTGRSGGRVDHASCGYKVRAQANRAARIEWEHIVPAWVFGHQRQCWQHGGRDNCQAEDPLFSVMEADLHNLAPAIGEVNADRSNFQFGVLPTTPPLYGACSTKVDFKARTVEPRDEVKGMIARVYFYMHDRYDLTMSDAQQRLFMAWHAQYPVTEWELERDRRIAQIMGHSNPFVTGERQWTRGHRNSREGLFTPIPEGHPALRPAPAATTTAEAAMPAAASNPSTGRAIIGNRNSKIYHLPEGCPSYDQVSPKNQVLFASETDAQAAGYRKAGNCR